jgi:uracil-DNA glycosylase
MDAIEEFSEQQVRDIIDAALGSLNSSSVVPLSFSDSDLLEKLYHLLPKYIGTYSDASYIISCLREELYSTQSHLSVQQLHTITHNCTKCPNATSRAETPLWNVSDPDVVLVVDNPYVLNQAAIDLLVEGLKTAGFSSTRLALTYATRCRFPPKTLEPADFARCSHYLYAELHALKPKLTIAFGSSVYGILTGDRTAKIKEAKGTITWIGPFPIMAEYTLGYIIQSSSHSSSTVSYLEQDLRKAYNFCYGERT